MQTEEYKDLTYTEAEIIDYDFFSIDGITRHLELVKLHKDSMDIDEIIRVEVRTEMFRALSIDALYDYFYPLEGWSKPYIQQQKDVIKQYDAEAIS